MLLNHSAATGEPGDFDANHEKQLTITHYC